MLFIVNNIKEWVREGVPVLVYAGLFREMYGAVVRLIAGLISRLLQYG